MKKQFVKTALALAVASTLAAPAFANTNNANQSTNGGVVAGYDGLGEQSARSAALQLNYFSHADRDNIWVNPALASEYRNSMEFSKIKTNDSTYGGLLYGIGDSQTVGIYLRNNASKFAKSTSFNEFGTNNNLVGTNDNFNLGNSAENPQNQFDLFYSMDMGDMAFGARLNYQAVDRSREDEKSTLLNTTGLQLETTGFGNHFLTTNSQASLESSIAQQKQQMEASYAVNLVPAQATLDNLRADAKYKKGLVSGNLVETTENKGSWAQDANELNISLGFNLKSLGIDGALLIGQASGEQTRSRSKDITNTQYAITAGDAQKSRVTFKDNETWKDTAEIDDGSSLGLSLRGLVMETDSSTLHASFLYSSQDYSGKLNSVRKKTTTTTNYDWANSVNNADWDSKTTSTTTRTEDERYSGSNIDEREIIQVGAAFRTMLTESTAATAMLGFRMETQDGGYELTRTADVTNTKVAQVNPSSVNPNTDNNVWNTDYGVTQKLTNSTEAMSLPFVLAAEHSFNERWTVRGSVSKDLYRSVEYTETNYTFNGVKQADARTPDTTGAARNTSTKVGQNQTVQDGATSKSEERTWNTPTTVAFGVGYENQGVTVDTLLSTTNGESTFAGITMGYKW